MSNKNIVHIAVAVIQNSLGQYLIAKRPQETHQGGLWEFPGGKVESNETVVAALKRELLEEVGITITQSSPLIKIHHDYNDKSVLLDVWQVEKFTGDAFGREGQKTCWTNKSDFLLYDFPAANLPIITAIKLPDKYMITGDFKSEDELLSRIKSGVKKGIELLQFRAHHLREADYFTYAKKIHEFCKIENVTLLLNTSIEKYNNNNAFYFSDGVHLTKNEIGLLTSDCFSEILVSTSVHDEKELLAAEKSNVDLVLLSPVNKTRTHPNTIPLGWDEFESLTKKANIPVYALGGMKVKDIKTSKAHGGQGIAAIGEFWSE